LFSAEQMEQHGALLASLHRLAPRRGPDVLLARLTSNEAFLAATCDHLTDAAAAGHRITPAAEWLLDNFHLVEEQIRAARRHLPKGYSRELPGLADGPSVGLPRVYDIALEAIAHGDGRVDPHGLRRFVAAYQTVAPLRLGELWAIPIMLRLAIIENLRRVGVRIAEGRADRDIAVMWAHKLEEVAATDPKDLILVLADMARSHPPMSTPFVSELARRLQGQGAALALPLTWIEQRLAESGLSIEQMVNSGTQQQAGDQVSIANSIGSLRLLGTMDWRDFVEEMSHVEATLRTDPASAYAAMDFATRDRYRHVVERLAKAGRLAEDAVAGQAVALAAAAAAREGPAHRTAHVGFWLIEGGLLELEKRTRARPPPGARLRRWLGRRPLLWYLSAVVSLTGLLAAVLVRDAHAHGVAGWGLGALGVLTLLATSHAAVALVNWVTTWFTTPHLLPRMDYSGGIPPESRTLAVVPTMLTSAANVARLVDALEVRFLANRDASLHWGLLTDFRDAAQETLPDDARLLDLLRGRVEALNEQYAEGRNDTFFLFHRPRRWNPRDGIWMGHERKRGKLADLNALLREGNAGGFSLVEGAVAALAGVRYVITLDTDTEIPRDAARQLVGTMAHPLNRPVFDERAQRVLVGYGILQPRVGVSLPGITRSRYARLHGGEPGIDPYTRAVSDVYQDAFHEGSFIGKGIYDLEAFERAIQGRFPENRILSHDLLEGCYARSGLVSDVELYEDNPSRYDADVHRRHRWIRGDWQLVGWLLPWVGDAEGRLRGTGLSSLSRWKLFDNLRRSLVPATLTSLFLVSWAVLASAWLWTLALLGILLLPPVLATLLDALRKPEEMRLDQHLAAAARTTGLRLRQTAVAFVFLPHEAYYTVDAVVRTLGRLLITRRRLLEWNPSLDVERRGAADLLASFRLMWIAPALALGSAVWLSAYRPAALGAAGVILGLWLASPALAWWVSLPLPRREARLTEEQTRFLGRIARKTWAFFDTFVTGDDHWLPPDNHQEGREHVLAHRTSPTNMGLALLANLAALDFGYVPAGSLVERTARTLDTMAGLARYRGHFFNWYDTRSLESLRPTYVSTVDSGNLAGHLLTLRAGLWALPDRPILEVRWLEGLRDTLAILDEDPHGIEPTALAAFRREMDAASEPLPSTLRAARPALQGLAEAARAMVPPDGDAVEEGGGAWWARVLLGQCEAIRDDLALLAPIPDAASGRRGTAPVMDPDTMPTLRTLAAHGSAPARARMAEIERLAEVAGTMADMDFSFLYDRSSRLLSIGYNVEDRRPDPGSYDLLASEARLSVFVAIALGQLPQESWFALGRLLTTSGGETVLLSWSGSMFEYLMPELVMPTFEHTLLEQTGRAAVAAHRTYGRRLGIPWGMSESGYNAVGVHLDYQYRAFGVPGLGLKRGLAEDRVVAPYASALALMAAPEEACLNLQRLSAEGAEGPFGFHEALDFTPSRTGSGEAHALVRSYMAHHQGMSLLALAHLLLDRPMQRRFVSDPLLKATLPLLQERIPRASREYAQAARIVAGRAGPTPAQAAIRVMEDADTPVPEVQLLSNGRYHVMVTNAGGGYSRWRDLAVTRWREDGTRDPWGSFCYLRDEETGAVWTTAYQPGPRRPDTYQAIFSAGRAEFRRRDGDFHTHTRIVVSPEDDIELRRVRITNRSRSSRTVEVTSYAEVVLAAPAADELHPAFSNLFVQTEVLEDRRAILCTRRPRSSSEAAPWMFHLVAARRAAPDGFSYETDRSRFLGRGRTPASPRAMDAGVHLSGSEGSVLDPAAAIRCRITLGPEESAVVDLVYGVGESRDDALALVTKYQDRRLADRVFELATTHAQVVLRQINASEADAQTYGRLANSVIHADAALRANPTVLMKNRRGQSALWGYAISGDLPIVLLRVGDLANLVLVRQLIQAHAYWRQKGLAVDLVIWNEDRAGYRQVLQEEILGLVAGGIETHLMDRPGGIFVRSAEHISEEDRVLFQTVARVVLNDAGGTLAEQVERLRQVPARVPPLLPRRAPTAEASGVVEAAPRDLILFNGVGGFTPDGREYVITTTPELATPAPWVNVLANPHFGSVVSENGPGYTWAENAHEYRLTPWSNDPVSDPGGEAFYLRDEESGRFWSPTPLPTRRPAPYVTRHGFGYSVFEHAEGGIHSELWVYLAHDAPVKFFVLKLRNDSGRTRRLSATGYVEWVLGNRRSRSAMHVTTEVDPVTGVLYARNPYNVDFPGRVAFFDVDDVRRTATCDRVEFIGRNGTLKSPAAMTRAHLSGRAGAGLDPCAALQVSFDLSDGEERQVTFRLGLGGVPGGADAASLASRYRGAAAARRALEGSWQLWNHTLGAVQVETPDESLNVLANGWLLYQTMACRLWGRSGYYQSGGAFGFRDQLQDVMALVHAEPGLTRAHLLLCAGRQFPEGDVQHWWHPPSGKGVRTHCSDDYLWLPLATSRYVLTTGDTGVLEEQVPFIEGRPLNPEDESYYDLPGTSMTSASLYEHCVRAIRRGLAFGRHGLPLMGTGDWNDGMNRVGAEGRGESVWLGFFLCEVLRQFAAVARLRDDAPIADLCAVEGARLRENLDRHGWDGAWYRRAYFDDGTPLGSAESDECRIDSISQSWAVLSGAGDSARARQAMEAVDERLVRRDHSLVQLLDPPFDRSQVDPGYIKGYVPGVRENGGQYTHAAIWAAMAFASLGDRGRAWELMTMINPANHATSPEAIERYKVEPYAVAADVYAVEPHIGRGGWTWYTGSAAWMYRLILESLLGLRLDVDRLHIEPCLPPHWPGLTIHYRHRETVYHIAIHQAGTGSGEGCPQATVTLDGVQQDEPWIPMVDDRVVHHVTVTLGDPQPGYDLVHK
jgi:cellobiose phosphorylase